MVRFKADPLSIRVDHHQIEARPLILAIANGRQYGNGALIAPDARVDDGKLDVVVVAERALWRTAARVPDLFRGRLKQVPGVTMMRGEEIEIASTRQVLYHVDGEPYVGGPVIHVRVRPGALRVRVPAS